MRQIPVKDNPGLVRDVYTGAVCNINRTEVLLAKRRKEKMLVLKGQQRELEKDVEVLKNEVTDIKNLLTQIIEKL